MPRRRRGILLEAAVEGAARAAREGGVLPRPSPLQLTDLAEVELGGPSVGDARSGLRYPLRVVTESARGERCAWSLRLRTVEERRALVESLLAAGIPPLWCAAAKGDAPASL